MSSPINVEWIISSPATPKIKRPCTRCNIITSFGSTGKFRLNANGTWLSAWLIYKCSNCGTRWNRTFFARRSVNDLPADLIFALQENDSELADRFARQVAGTSQEGIADNYRIDKQCLEADRTVPAVVVLSIQNPQRLRVRLDHVLANGLGVSRKQLIELVNQQYIRFMSASPKALKRRVPPTIEMEVQSGSLVAELSLIECLVVAT